MMKWIITISAIALVAGMVLVNHFKEELPIGRPIEIPEHLKLKVHKNNIVGAREYEEGKVQYVYKTHIIQDSEDEIVEKRTPSSKTFRKGKNEKGEEEYQTYVYPAHQFYKEENVWWQVEPATTTKRLYEQQMGISWFDKLFKEVYAATGYYEASGTSDGQVDAAGTCGTWASKRDHAGVNSADTLISIKAMGFTTASCSPGDYDLITRGIVGFDTSGLPDDAVVSEVKFGVCFKSLYNGFNCNTSLNSGMVICRSNAADPSNIATGDYDAFTTVYGSSSPMSNYAAEGWATTTLNAAGNSYVQENMDAGEWSSFGIMDGWDEKNLIPESNDCTHGADKNQTNYIYAVEQTGTAQDPNLLVTYSLPSAALPIQEFWVE